MEPEPWIFIALCCLTLAVPFGYALATLLGMQGKTVIPLLRTRDAEGHIQVFAHPSNQRRVVWSQSAM